MSRILTDAELRHYTEVYQHLTSWVDEHRTASGDWLGTSAEVTRAQTVLRVRNELPDPGDLWDATWRTRSSGYTDEYGRLVQTVFDGLEEIRRVAPAALPRRTTVFRRVATAISPVAVSAADRVSHEPVLSRELRGILVEPGQVPWWAWTLMAVSSAASAYHGYKRHGTVGGAIGWGLAGAVFPVITPAVAVAQGYGKRRR